MQFHSFFPESSLQKKVYLSRNHFSFLRYQPNFSSKILSPSSQKFLSQRWKSKISLNTTGELFDKILIANRGEIAVRVMKTAKKLGIKTVAVFSEVDRDSMHVAMADEAYLIGPAPSQESYLKMQTIIDVAKRSGAKAIHPGYGFLSENAGFAELCEKSGIEFIGPPASAIRDMGSKSESKIIMAKANVPLIPGYHGEAQDVQTLKKEAEKIGFPVLIKAVMGGGGKGMKIVNKPEEFEAQLISAKEESMNSFNNDRVLLEKYITRPRHIEFQIFADKFGNVVHLFERDCSVQRRHQKIIEEAPAPHMTPELRHTMGQAAINAAKAVGYVGAGTVEFIFDIDQNKFYFMEMNTRLQVEHPVSEMITRHDLVEWQLKVAANQKLPASLDDLKIHGHAFEARIYAENPDRDFMPGTGKLIHLVSPTPNEHVRVETGVREGDTVSVYYDPMIAKLVVWGSNRVNALNRLRINLEKYQIIGLPTNVNFLHRLASHPSFIKGEVETGFIPKFKQDLMPAPKPISSTNLAVAVLGMLLYEKKQNLIQNNIFGMTDINSPFNSVDGRRFNHTVTRTIELVDNETPLKVSTEYVGDGTFIFKLPSSKTGINVSGKLQGQELTAFVGDQLVNATIVFTEFELRLFTHDTSHMLKIPSRTWEGTQDSKDSLRAPLPGKITKILVTVGQEVKKGDLLIALVSMKTEFKIFAPYDGIVTKINCKLDEIVKEKTTLILLKGEESK